jgi:hypothetical protein
MQIMQDRGRFVHYTNSVAGISIVRNKKVWMRKPQWMNDWSEIDHGFNCLQYTYQQGQGGKQFKDALNQVLPGLVDKVTKHFDGWLESYRRNSYVACVARHDPAEDHTGRLSMWTGHCANNGVAFVLKSDPFTAISDVLGAYSFPVAYRTREEVDASFGSLSPAIAQNAELIKEADPNFIEYMVHELFKYSMLCTKHHSFKDEQEWRIVYTPDRDATSPRLMEKSVEFINGAPQPVFNIPLAAHPGYDISLPTILDRIVIGPTRFPGAVWESFVHELDLAGVPEAAKKVFFSEIPLRV